MEQPQRRPRGKVWDNTATWWLLGCIMAGKVPRVPSAPTRFFTLGWAPSMSAFLAGAQEQLPGWGARKPGIKGWEREALPEERGSGAAGIWSASGERFREKHTGSEGEDRPCTWVEDLEGSRGRTRAGHSGFHGSSSGWAKLGELSVWRVRLPLRGGEGGTQGKS